MNPLEASRRLLGRNVYKRTTEGNPAIAQGSLARRYPGITMQGWTEQPQYEGKNLLNKNSSNWVVGKSLTWSAESGTPIGYSGNGVYAASILIEGIKPSTKYSFKNLDASKLWVNRIIFADGLGNGYQNVPLYGNPESHNHEEYSITSANNENITHAYFQVRTLPSSNGEGVAITDQDIKDMLVCFSEGEPIYEPYTGGAPSPSPEYPQPITSAGKYNEDTQKWEYEITIANEQTDPDKNQTVTLTSDRPLTKWDKLEKRNGQWGWVYKSAEIESYTDESVPGEYFSTTGQLSTGAQVWYETTTETFVPLLESEQEAMNALHTFRPTTVLSNDCECEMTLTYKTKKSLEVTT